jgi:hypothetical protein
MNKLKTAFKILQYSSKLLIDCIMIEIKNQKLKIID